MAIILGPFSGICLCIVARARQKVTNAKIEADWHMRPDAVAKLPESERPNFFVPGPVQEIAAHAAVQEQVVEVYKATFENLSTAVRYVKDAAYIFEQRGFPDLALHLRASLRRTNFWVPDEPALTVHRHALISVLKRRSNAT